MGQEYHWLSINTHHPCMKMGSNHARPRQKGHPVHEKGGKTCTAQAKVAPRAQKRPKNVHGVFRVSAISRNCRGAKRLTISQKRKSRYLKKGTHFCITV